MKNNISLFNFSLKNPEPLIDKFYIKKGGLIIPQSQNNPNKLLKTWYSLLENISAFSVAMSSENTKMKTEILGNIQSLMKEKEINFSEFASFWPVMDVSHSTFFSLSSSAQLSFLEEVLVQYIKMRHKYYRAYGYSPVTLQVSKDAKSHKVSGSLGINKAAQILESNGYERLKILTLSEFHRAKRVYIFSDKTGRSLFIRILEKYHIDFQWSIENDRKMPDLLFKFKGDLFIVEHKHMKEVGGGQNKQVTEVIGFISYTESKSRVRVHYVVFMDGSYFNFFTEMNKGKNNKINSQIGNIKRNLESNPKNYFVNTAGFYGLLSGIAK